MAAHQPLSVFVFTTSFPRWEGDDAGIFVQRLVAAVAKLGIEEHVFVPRDHSETPEEEKDEYTVTRFRYSISRGTLAFGAGIMPNVRRNPLALMQAPGLLAGFVVAALRKSRCHVVHANWLVTTLPALLYATVARCPFVVTARGEDTKLLRKRAARALLAIPLSRASAVIAVSNSVAEELRALVPSIAKKLSVIPNGVEFKSPTEREIQRLRDERSLAKGVRYLVFVGSVIPRKRLDVVVRALKEIGRPDVTLIVAGRLDDEGCVSQLKDLVKELSLEEQVRLEGPIPPGDVATLLAIGSVYVTASDYEGRPNSVLEAMAAGVPVVASDIPAHREIITNEQNGFLCSEASQFGQAIKKILESNSLRDAVGERGRHSIEHLSWKRTAQAYRDLFVSIHRAHSTVEVDAPHRHSKPH
jgi:glycosyltransferase involved in cell wall biosynthesis